MRVLEYGWTATITCHGCKSRLEIDYGDVRAVQRRADAADRPLWSFRADCCVCGSSLRVPVNHTYIESTLIQAALDLITAAPIRDVA